MDKDIEIKHFRSVARGDKEKEIVTELVEEGAETHIFLQKMEAARKKRECLLTLDMRGKVAGLCQQFVYKNREFYIDDVSKAMLLAGMTENNGVFTVGTYEDIVFGDHTLRAQRQRAADSSGKPSTSMKMSNAGMLGKSRIDSPHLAPMSSMGKSSLHKPTLPQQGKAVIEDEDAEIPPPEVVTFGYVKRREEDRLEMVVEVVLELNGVRYPAKTRDVSRGGAQIYLAFVPGLTAGTQVFISFTEFQGQTTALLDRVPYVIVRCEEGELQITLSMRREVEGSPDVVGDALERHIGQYSKRCRVNLDDDVNMVVSLIYERIYTENCDTLPLFIGKAASGQREVVAWGSHTTCDRVLDFLDRPDNTPDLTPFILPQRVHLFAEAFKKNRDIYLLAYRSVARDQGGQLHTVCNIECESSVEFKDLLRFALCKKEYKIFQIQMAEITMPSDLKLNSFLGALQQESETVVQQLVDRVAELSLLATLHDVTKAAVSGLLASDISSEAVKEGKGLLDITATSSVIKRNRGVWVGRECRGLADGVVRRTVATGSWVRPVRIEMGYLKRRGEERYVLQSEVELEIDGRIHAGETTDISTKGVGVMLKEELSARVDTAVMMTFDDLQRRVSHVRLKNVPYLLKRIGDDKRRIGLLSSSDSSAKAANSFFADMIVRNRDKLEKDLGDLFCEAQARVHESIFAENLTTLPIFFYRGEAGLMLGRVGANDVVSAVAEYFDMGDGYPDFRPLARKALIGRMLSIGRTASSAANQPVDMTLYTYKQVTDDSARQKLVIIDDVELEKRQDKFRALQQLLLQPHLRVFRFIVWPLSTLREHEFETLLESITQQSRHKAQKLREELKMVVGLGEIIDVTGLFRY